MAHDKEMLLDIQHTIYQYGVSLSDTLTKQLASELLRLLEKRCPHPHVGDKCTFHYRDRDERSPDWAREYREVFLPLIAVNCQDPDCVLFTFKNGAKGQQISVRRDAITAIERDGRRIPL